MITWQCNQCDEPLEAPESASGQSFDCPKCGTPSKPLVATASAASSTSRGSRVGGLFDALLGNASNMAQKDAKQEVHHLLVPGERVELAYKLVRDLFVFTDRRLILIDKQGITGKKVEYHSIPYKNIMQFSVETAGTFDRDAELKVYISGCPHPIEKQFRKDGANILDVQRALATAIVGNPV